MGRKQTDSSKDSHQNAHDKNYKVRLTQCSSVAPSTSMTRDRFSSSACGLRSVNLNLTPGTPVFLPLQIRLSHKDLSCRAISDYKDQLLARKKWQPLPLQLTLNKVFIYFYLFTELQSSEITQLLIFGVFWFIEARLIDVGSNSSGCIEMWKAKHVNKQCKFLSRFHCKKLQMSSLYSKGKYSS